tara:strand:- start:66101 stop:66241 length:141 start_codon:yes stop_codon:yes gene_type:complete
MHEYAIGIHRSALVVEKILPGFDLGDLSDSIAAPTEITEYCLNGDE